LSPPSPPPSALPLPCLSSSPLESSTPAPIASSLPIAQSKIPSEILPVALSALRAVSHTHKSKTAVL
jgi:hypothetical protein